LRYYLDGLGKLLFAHITPPVWSNRSQRLA
jgi:hypothetical protein